MSKRTFRNSLNMGNNKFPIFLIIAALTIFILPALFNELSAGVASRRNKVVIAVEKIGATVVSLSAKRRVVQRHIDPLYGFRSKRFNEYFNDFFGNFEEKKVEFPLGSGVIIDEDGYIVTNEHVVSQASSIEVSLHDGKTFKATVVSSDPKNDLAILKIETDKPLPYINMGISDDLMIGETVIALGNPFGLGNSVTTGVLSAKNRKLKFNAGNLIIEYNDLIQTDALINPGNSGGPLVNIDGELIGINTVIIEQGQGIGFAIPVNKVKQTLVKLFNFSEKNKLWVGVKARDAKEGNTGVEITEVEEDSPAEKAGLKQGDIIVKLDTVDIIDMLDYEKFMLKKSVGDTVSMLLIRNMASIRLPLTLEKTPAPSGSKLARDKLGISVQQLTLDIAKSLGLRARDYGILISAVDKGGPADNVGIKQGYVIVRMGPYRITNLEELGIILNKVYSGEIIDIGLIWADSYGEHRGYAKVEVE